MCRSTQLGEHYALVGKPETYYLKHLSPIDGKGRTLAQEIFILETVLCERFTIIGTYGTASKTEKTQCCHKFSGRLLKNLLQWSICFLHTNELPLRNVNSTTNCLDSFIGAIVKQLDGYI